MILHNYLSNSGRDLIYEYINSLPEAEKIDGYTVLQHMEKGEFDKILFKRWEKKVYEVYFQKNNRVFYITVDKENIYICSIPVENRKIKQKKGCKYSTEAGKRIRKYVRQEVYLEGVVNMPFLK